MDVGIWQTIPQPAISRYLGLMGWADLDLLMDRGTQLLDCLKGNNGDSAQQKD